MSKKMIISIAVVILVIVVILFADVFRNLPFKLHYNQYSFSGTKEKMDALNQDSLAQARIAKQNVTIVIHGAETEYYKDPFGTVVWFRENGVNAVSFDYDFKAAPDESAQKLAAYVQEILQQTGTTKVNIFAVCLGGTLARYYTLNFGGAAYVENLVTVISPAVPIPASDLAYQYNKHFSFNPEPWNDVLEKIKDRNAVDKHIYFYCKRDLTVFPKYQYSEKGNFEGLICGHMLNNVNPEPLRAALELFGHK